MPDIEHCCACGEPTGRAGRGEDSIYIDTSGGEIGPLCAECLDAVIAWARESDDACDGTGKDPVSAALASATSHAAQSDVASRYAVILAEEVERLRTRVAELEAEAGTLRNMIQNRINRR